MNFDVSFIPIVYICEKHMSLINNEFHFVEYTVNIFLSIYYFIYALTLFICCANNLHLFIK